MVGVIKEICIFMIISQAVLFFVPGQSYVKYVRVLVGIIMILRITEPVFGLVLNEEKQKEISNGIWKLEERILLESKKIQMENQENSLLGNVEEEIRERLETCESGYEIRDVSFSEQVYAGAEYSGKEELIIRVAEKKDGSKEKISIDPVKLGEKKAAELEEEQELKNLYGKCLGVEEDRIKIVME